MTSLVPQFILLVVGAIVAIHSLHLLPRTPRQWIYVAITIAFLAWILPMTVTLRSH